MLLILGLFIVAGILAIFNYLEVLDWEDFWCPCAITFVVLGILMGIVIAISIPCTIQAYGELESVPKVTALYDAAIADVIQAMMTARGDIAVENLAHSTQVAKAISDKRDYLTGMEERKFALRRNYQTWYTRQFMARPPDGLLD